MRLLPVALALSFAAISYADIITLKNGRIINGTYLGGTPRQIKVEVGDNIQTLDIGDIARIEFSNGGSGSTSSRGDSAPRDDRPTLRRADGSSSSSSSGLGSGSGSGSGSQNPRPVILQPDPNDTGGYSSGGSSLPVDDSRPTLKRSSSSSSSDSGSSSSSSDDSKPTLRRASDSSSSDSSSSSDDSKPTLRRASDSSSSSAPPASSSSSDGDRPVLRRATQDAPAAAPAQSPTPAAAAPAPPPAPVAVKVGQKQDDVIAALGQPDSVSAEGDKQTYVYGSRNLKITFVNGKVSKVE